MYLLRQESCLLSKSVINCKICRRRGARRDVTSEHHVTRLPSLVRSFQEACFDGFLLRIRENL